MIIGGARPHLHSMQNFVLPQRNVFLSTHTNTHLFLHLFRVYKFRRVNHQSHFRTLHSRLPVYFRQWRREFLLIMRLLFYLMTFLFWQINNFCILQKKKFLVLYLIVLRYYTLRNICVCFLFYYYLIVDNLK